MSSPPTIHVIDDDHAVRDSLGMLLECHGFPIQLYASAASFLNRERSTVACSPTWMGLGSLASNFSTGFATEEWRSHQSS